MTAVTDSGHWSAENDRLQAVSSDWSRDRERPCRHPRAAARQDVPEMASTSRCL